jgi:hypothetical protein
MTMLRDEQRFSQFVITVKGHAPEAANGSHGDQQHNPESQQDSR